MMGGAARRVAVLFGGRSVEHEVSVVSARGVMAGLDPRRSCAVPIAITGEGRWLSPELSRRMLVDGRARVELADGEDDGAWLAADPGAGGIVRVDPGRSPVRMEIDAVFPVVHGWGGEDGRLQGLLDLARVPYVGAGVAGSAVAMDKAMARALVERYGIPVAPWLAFRASDWHDDPAAILDRIVSGPGLPVFVKPANGGSSVGISKVREREGLAGAVEIALRHDRRVVVEHAIDAREIEVAVLGNDRPQASVPGEIVPGAEFYTYEDKYRDGVAGLHVPAPLDASTAAEVRRLAVEAYVALDLAGLARVDFLLDRRSGRPLFNEANTLPGFTPISMYSKMWEASGLSYADLLERLVDLAIERARGVEALASRRT